MKKLLFGIIILILVVFVQFSFAVPADAQNAPAKVVPRIDDEAAYIEKTNTPAPKAEGFSQNFWMFLFGAYLFIMLFNLSSDFEKKEKMQWFWEAVFTFLAVYAWDNLDPERANNWFPGAVMESGIIIYGFYFFFLNRKNRKI